MEQREHQSYRQAFEDAKAEREECLAEEEQLVDRLSTARSRIESLNSTVDSLGVLLGETSTKGEVGLTDAVRELLKADKLWWAPTAVRAHLKKKGFPINEYKQPLSVIHTTLKRLVDQGELKVSELKGKTHYKWDSDREVGITDDDIPF